LSGDGNSGEPPVESDEFRVSHSSKD
jgi:hypothetical protein